MKQYEHNITFELNESLSLETGQEIGEMISISLDPDIVIQSYADFVQIRGIILLAGEYHHTGRESNDRHDGNKRNLYIEQVTTVNDQVRSFSHRFPVEISVTKERVENIEDVIVTVDSFDYDIPSADTLNVYASLHIYGIRPEKEVTEEVVNEDVKTEAANKEEAKVKKIADKSEEKIDKITFAKDKSEAGVELMKQKDHKKDKSLDEDKQRPLKLVKDNRELPIDDREQEDIVQDEMTEEKVEKNDQTVNEAGASLQEQEDQEMHIELTEGKNEEDSDVKDAAFLTELFEEEEEMFTQLTIYIAQEDDSIESIAKRYELPVLQLLKDNQLASDTIEAGQLITIRQKILS